MITARSILASLERRGVRLQLEAGELRAVEHEPGTITPRMRATVRNYRPALLAALTPRTSPTCTGCGKHHFATPQVCYWCRSREVA